MFSCVKTDHLLSFGSRMWTSQCRKIMEAPRDDLLKLAAEGQGLIAAQQRTGLHFPTSDAIEGALACLLVTLSLPSTSRPLRSQPALTRRHSQKSQRWSRYRHFLLNLRLPSSPRSPWCKLKFGCVQPAPEGEYIAPASELSCIDKVVDVPVVQTVQDPMQQSLDKIVDMFVIELVDNCTTSAAVTAGEKSVGEDRPPGMAEGLDRN